MAFTSSGFLPLTYEIYSSKFNSQTDKSYSMRNLFPFTVLFILGCLCVSQVSAQELSAEEIVARA
ncbi:MAG: hypothetical protein KDC45_01215, partial [Bacteroidetes bacterium]|nr:hypothetical protein [Bacteroidota bacterium]